MKRGLALLLLLLLILFVVSCTPAEKKVQPLEQPLPIVKEIAQDIVVYEPEIASVLDRIKGVSNYYYLYDATTPKGYEVFVRDNRVKKVYLEPVKLDQEIYYNEVYLDLENKTAIGICTKQSVTCTPAWGKVYLLFYGEELPLISPLELARHVPGTAKKVGEAVVDERDTIIISYTSGNGNIEQLYLDRFTGLPLEQLQFAHENDETPLLKHIFTDVAVGNVRAADVTLPESYVNQ